MNETVTLLMHIKTETAFEILVLYFSKCINPKDPFFIPSAYVTIKRFQLFKMAVFYLYFDKAIGARLDVVTIVFTTSVNKQIKF